MIVRKHFRFTGRVQGVGFRYRAKYAANGMGITGWAKNQADGSVEMEAQWPEEAINRMLVMINKSDYIVIDSIDSCELPIKEGECSFMSYSFLLERSYRIESVWVERHAVRRFWEKISPSRTSLPRFAGRGW